MGRGMAASLARAGLQVAQYDRHTESLAASSAQSELITPVDELRTVAQHSKVMVVSVAGEAAERAVFLGKGGLFECAAPQSLLIGCGTITVSFARELHTAAEARGLRFLDAPVSGGPEGAAKGTLSIMCGGSQPAFDAARPVLDGMGGYVVRMGEAGAGAAAKLINQLLTAANAHAATEALALARAQGLDTPDALGPLLALLERSWGNSTMLQRTGGLVIEALKAAADTSGGSTSSADALATPAAAPLRNFAKDLDFVLQAAASANLVLPSTLAARRAVSVATALGKDSADWAYVSEMHGNARPVAVAAPPAASRATAAPPAVYASLAELDASLPPPWREGERALQLRNGVLAARKGSPLVVVDDDPTGTQTVHSVPVLADWSVEALASALMEDVPCFYVLANTRALPPAEAVKRAETIGANLRLAAGRCGIDPTSLGVVSRGDSTLRGHYPAETDALARGLGWQQPALLLAPFFLEGGRYTAHDVHYVAASDGSGMLTPCAETEFARDRAFGYSQSHLPSWVEEQTGGRVRAADVCSLSLDLIRTGGPDAVQAVLAALPDGGAGAVIVANALTPSDMSVVSLGCMQFATVELRVAQLAQGGDAWAAEESRARFEVEEALRREQSVVMHTSREVLQDDGQGGLLIGERVNRAIVSLVRSLAVFPSFLVAKGGITSNDVAVEGLGVRRADVLGSVRPGVPVWRCGPESRAPGLAYVVFPGNVGAKDDLAKVAQMLSGGDATESHAAAASRLVHGGAGGASVPSLLREARDRRRAVGAFNVYNLEGAIAVRKAAEASGMPAILQLHPASMAFGGSALIAACLAVADGCRVPILCQLDHAEKREHITAALAAGVHGVMADGCRMPLDENTRWTAELTRLVHASGASVEAELGLLAGEEDGLSVAEKDAKMTDPAVVRAFLDATAVDALAVTIGNVHGKYAVNPPILDWARLDAVRAEAGETPLVLHGASGLPDEMITRAIGASICKFNVNTEVRGAMRAAVKASSGEGKDVLDVMGCAVDAMVPVITAKMRAFAPHE